MELQVHVSRLHVLHMDKTNGNIVLGVWAIQIPLQYLEMTNGNIVYA